MFRQINETDEIYQNGEVASFGIIQQDKQKISVTLGRVYVDLLCAHKYGDDVLDAHGFII